MLITRIEVIASILTNPTGFPGSLPGNHVCYCIFALHKTRFHIFVAEFLLKKILFFLGKPTYVVGKYVLQLTVLSLPSADFCLCMHVSCLLQVFEDKVEQYRQDPAESLSKTLDALLVVFVKVFMVS